MGHVVFVTREVELGEEVRGACHLVPHTYLLLLSDSQLEHWGRERALRTHKRLLMLAPSPWWS